MKDIMSYQQYNKEEVFAVLLDLLQQFKSICASHNLHFYAQGGTMLGAVRHKGFIPWDDDIDVAMMRDDYDRLLQLIPEMQLPEPYQFLTPLTDMQYCKGLIRLCNTNTTAIPIHDAGFEYNNGIFIDIFPLDAIPGTKLKVFLYKHRIDFLHNLLVLSGRFYLKNGSVALTLPRKIVYYLLRPLVSLNVLSKEKIFRSFTKAASKYQNKGEKKICLSTFAVLQKYTNDIKDYEVEIIDMPFENTTIPVPITYHTILVNHFGQNYMTPVQEKTNHGDTLFSTKIPYKQFREMYHDELQRIWIDCRKQK